MDGGPAAEPSDMVAAAARVVADVVVAAVVAVADGGAEEPADIVAGPARFDGQSAEWFAPSADPTDPLAQSVEVHTW